MALWIGTYLVMFDYPVTRDEHMVVFDMQVFRQGKLAEHLPSRWSGYATALVPYFLLDVPSNQLLISAYMPMNAAARAAFGLIADPALMNPLFTAAGLFLIYKVAIKLFADCSGAVWTVLLGYVLSSQILMNAMTDYAMAGHLTFNLLWLLLYLKGTRLALAGAMAIGFVAVGYHQIVFQPLFAAPFVLYCAYRRRWPLFFSFCAAYGTAALFWTSYPHLVIWLSGVDAGYGSTSGVSGFVQHRFTAVFSGRNLGETQYLIFNLLRIVSWAPLFVLPLFLLALPPERDQGNIPLLLLAGILTTLIFMIVVIPTQGHGWGYRYLHPVMGNIILTAGYGYRRIAKTEKPATDRLVVNLGTATAFACLPFLLWTSREFVEPYTKLTALIERQSSDFVIVDTEPPSAAIDLVRNDADLANRPLIFSSKDLSTEQIREICRRGTIALVSRREFDRAEFALGQPESQSFQWVANSLKDGNCLRRTI